MASIEIGVTSNKGLWFSMFIDSEEFIAFIPERVLETRFKTQKQKKRTLSIYKDNQALIDSVAQRKFQAGHPRPIQLDDADFM